MVAHHYWELECWQLANDLKLRVYAFTAKMPVARDVKYCDQLRESTRSAPRNIAEGFGRYRPAEFARFLEIARASLTETHNHLRDGLDLNYLTEAECGQMFKLCDRASGATTNLLLYLRRCRRSPRRART